MAENGSFSRKQRAGIRALVEHRTVVSAAAASGIGERTIYTWLADVPGFRAAVDAGRAEQDAELNARALRRLTELQDKAIDTYEHLLDGADVSASVKRATSSDILTHRRTLTELEDIERRLSVIEGVISARI